MIFKVATWTVGLDSRRLDILVRLALPNVYQQRSFCCREHIIHLCGSVLNVSRMVGRLFQSSLVPPCGMVHANIHSSTTHSSHSLRDR